MLALSPPLFSTIGWPLEESTSRNQNYFYKDIEASESIFPHLFSSSQPQVEVERSTPSPARSSDPTMVKKLSHNASERDRRKKINSLYSSLRSLLPVAEQMKKLSIPATISRVLKYIPELRQQVEELNKKKQEILLRISKQGDAANKESQRKIAHHNSGFAVSTIRLNDSEATIQISSYKLLKAPLSEILLCLENDGLLLLNASSSETSGGRVFYNMHFHVEKSHRLESEILSKKLLPIYEEGFSNQICYVGSNYEL